MGKKRKPDESEAISSSKTIEKQKKKRRHSKENGAPTDDTTPSESSSIKSRLAKLERLTQKFTSDPEAIQRHAGECGVDLINSIAELGREFARAKHPQSSSSSSSSNAGVEAQASNPSFVASGPLTKHGLPALPPIKDKALETAVFTHSGISGERPISSEQEVSYDRLELLGDAYLEVIATRLIWDRFKTLSAGRLSQARELLVKNETLAEFATMYGFDKRARVPPEYVNQPKRWLKTKGDIFEAYVAGVVLSDPRHGFVTAEDWMAQLWLPKFKKIDPRQAVLNGKEELAKMVMSKGIKLKYLDESPPIRNGGLQTFFIGVYLTGWGWTNHHLGSGTGQSKAGAGDEAAKRALANKPLIDEIHAAKKAFDEKTQAEREKASS